MGTYEKMTTPMSLESPRVELEVFVSDPGAALSEGLVWDEQAGRLLWVDITAGLINALTPRTRERKQWRLPHEVGAVALRAGGGLVVADRYGFALLSESPADEPVRVEQVTPPGVRMNDGACDPAGSFWAGSMAFDERPGAGNLYRCSPDGSVEVMLQGVSVSNGIGWSRDGRRMYYVDTATRGIDVFDWRVGEPLGDRRRMVDLTGEAGAPDGLAVDAEDCVWVAMWGGWCVRRYSPEGDWLAQISLPVAQVTSCAFGGQDLDQLYISTAAHRLTDADRAAQPLAGSIFRCRPQVAGLASHRYAG
jgi:sugar lactone lactonase YvrE